MYYSCIFTTTIEAWDLESINQEYGDLPVAKGTVMRENGLRAADQPAREVDVTVEMQRKVWPWPVGMVFGGMFF